MAPRKKKKRLSPMKALMEQAAVTVEDVSAILRMSRGGAYAAIEQGKIPSIRIGHVIRVPSAALRALLQIEEPSEAAE